ncbi:transposase [Mesorhizobium sp. M0138]|uniref:IS110 family transposase n=1 Tax=Mesorhizobium sp. M0138 TaxID=2956891 RepID=UPI00333B1366
MTVKTDRNDAQGIAHIVRTGWFKAVHLKSAAGQRLRALTAARKAAVRPVTANEQVIRGLLRPDRVGRITKVSDSERRTALFEAANVILRPTSRWSSMKAWAMKIANRQGARRAKIALEWQSPFTACGLTNRISVGQQLRLSCPRDTSARCRARSDEFA